MQPPPGNGPKGGLLVTVQQHAKWEVDFIRARQSIMKASIKEK